MDKNLIKRIFNENHVYERDYFNHGGEYLPPEDVFAWTDINGEEKVFLIELNGDTEKELEAYELGINPDNDRVQSSFMRDRDLTYLLSTIFDKPSTMPSPEEICSAFNKCFDDSGMSLKLFKKKDYFEPGYNNRKYDTVNDRGYIYYKLNNTKTAFTVKDLKKFLDENKVPDDAVVRMCYEQCCQSAPSRLIHDRNTNEFVMVE